MINPRALSLIKTAAMLLVIAAGLYFSVRGVNFAELGQSFQNLDYFVALSIIPVILLSHLVRAHRWKVILSSIAPGIGISPLFTGVIIGYFMNNIIARSGEFVRPYVTAQRDSRTPYSSLLGSIIVERFIDTVGLLLIVAAVLVFDSTLFKGFTDIKGFADLEKALRGLMYMAIVLGLAFIVIAPSRLGYRLAAFFSAPLPAKFREKLLDIFTKLQKGFGSIRSTRQALIVFLETGLIYFLYMLPLYIMFFAVPSGVQTAPSLFDALRVLTVTSLAYAVAPTPGAFGVFHFTARVACMNMLNFTEADAVAYATIMHFINYSTVMIIGSFYMLTLDLSFKGLLRGRSTDASAA